MKDFKKRWIVGVCIILLLAGIGGKLYMDDKKIKDEKEQLVEVVRMERTAAKQIKNSYSNLTKIKFLDDYSYDSMTGFTLVNVIATSDSVKEAKFDISMSSNYNPNDSYTGSIARPKLKDGKTKTSITVIFSNGSEEEI